MHKNCNLENDWCDWCSVESIVCLENSCDVCLECNHGASDDCAIHKVKAGV